MSVQELLMKKEDQIHELMDNMNNLEYWEDHGDGGFWKPLTDEKADKIGKYLTLEDIRVKQ